MDTWRRRLLYYLAALVVLVSVYTSLYYYGMNEVADRPRSLLHCFQFVVETFTATGYGSDSPWQTPAMQLLVVVMDLTGVFMIFLALPVLIVPLFEDAFSTTVPTEIENGLEDHVIICSHSPRAAPLIAELDSWDVDYVIVEPDRETARDLYEDDHPVVHAEPNSVAGLEGANIEDARALVADVADRVDTSIVLTAKEITEDVPVVSVVEEPDRSTYHQLAGADTVLSPRPLLGERLASKVTTAVRSDADGAVEIGTDLEIAELPIRAGSQLEGRTLADSGIREQTGVNVLGAWRAGKFESPVSPEAELDRTAVLLVAGHAEQLDDLRERTLSSLRKYDGDGVILVGYGEVGKQCADTLDRHDVAYTVVDERPGDAVDVVGDATEPETLQAAGIEEARSVILAIPDDTTTEFTTLVLRDLSPETEIVARVDETESVQKMYRAGADYALSLETVTGRMIASSVLEEDIISLDTKVDIVRTRAPGLEGRTLADADVRANTGCTVIAVRRNGETLTDLGPGFRIERDDELVIAGTDEGTNEFTRRYR
jgi:Trk K+ transport system NAD-binding subunit